MKIEKDLKKLKNLKTSLSFALVALAFAQSSYSASVVLVGNAAGGGPIITTSSFGDIALGTRLRVGSFSDTALLNATISNFLTSAATFSATVSALNSNFIDFGNGAANAGSASQTGTGVSSSQVVVNTTATVTSAGTASTRNVFNGQILNVNYSAISGVGAGKSVYIWTAFNDEIGIFRDSGWTTPSSDLTGLTLNLVSITAASASTEVLLGGYKDWATGSDYLTLIPEPTSASLLIFGGSLVLWGRRRKSLTINRINKSRTTLSYLTIVSLTLLIGVGIGHAQTVSTPIVGFYKKTFPSGGSLQTSALVKASDFQGTASSVSGASLGTSTASWTVNQFAPSNGFPVYYVEITSGPLAGYTFDVLSNTANTVTLDVASLSGAGSNPTFLIRAHRKISEIFATATNLNDYQDQVTIYNSDGSTTTLLRDSGATTGWIDATTFDASDPILYPAQGFVLTTQASGQFTLTGQVNPNSTVVPLYANQPNIVSLSNPGDETKNIQSINLGTNLSDFNDQVAIYSQDGALSQSATLLWAGVSEGFYDATSFSAAVGVSITGTEPIIVTPVADTTWNLASPLNQ
jgi:hypothetical protein